MGIDAVLLVTGGFKTGAWVYLLVQGARLGLMRHYPRVYVFVACQLVGFWVRTGAVISLGADNPQYLWIYYGTIIPTELLALFILLWIYFLPFHPSIKRDWLLLAVLPVFAAMSITQPMHPFYRVSYVISFYLASVGGLAAWRLFSFRTLTLGANLRGLFYGIYIPAGLQAFNEALKYLGQEIWSYDAFRVVNELTTAISWGIIAFGMRRYDPLRVDEGGEALSQEEAVSRLKRLRKEIWRWP